MKQFIDSLGTKSGTKSISSIIFISALIVLPFLFTGCGNGGKKSLRMTDHALISEAEDSAGFKLSIPKKESWTVENIKSAKGKLIQADIVTKKCRVTLKKCRAKNNSLLQDGGDYENVVRMKKIGKMTDFRMMGRDGKTCRMTWGDKKFSYSLESEDGISNDMAMSIAIILITEPLIQQDTYTVGVLKSGGAKEADVSSTSHVSSTPHESNEANESNEVQGAER